MGCPNCTGGQAWRQLQADGERCSKDSLESKTFLHLSWKDPHTGPPNWIPASTFWHSWDFPAHYGPSWKFFGAQTRAGSSERIYVALPGTPHLFCWRVATDWQQDPSFLGLLNCSCPPPSDYVRRCSWPSADLWWPDEAIWHWRSTHAQLLAPYLKNYHLRRNWKLKTVLIKRRWRQWDGWE